MSGARRRVGEVALAAGLAFVRLVAALEAQMLVGTAADARRTQIGVGERWRRRVIALGLSSQPRSR
jgi:hypothetical protein